MKAETKEQPLVLVVVLAVVCALAGLALGFVYQLTGPSIHIQKQKADRAALLAVHPGASPEGLKLVKTEHEAHGEQFEYHEVYDKPLDDDTKELIGYACEGRAQGYSSTIVVTVGLSPDASTITGIKITAQQETPGLGANCEEVESDTYIWNIFSPRAKAQAPKPWFQSQFSGRSIDGLVPEGKSYKDVRALSGATITTNAVVRATLDAVETFSTATSLGQVDAETSATWPEAEGGGEE